MKKLPLLIVGLCVPLAAQYQPPAGGGGGSTIPSVTNVICGNGSGNGADCGFGPSVVVRKYFGTAPPGSVAGNLPGDLFSDSTNHNDYWCNAVSGTAAPACTSVTAGGWTLLNGGATYTGSLGINVAANNFTLDTTYACDIVQMLDGDCGTVFSNTGNTAYAGSPVAGCASLATSPGLKTGMIFALVPDTASTTTATFAPCGLTAKNIKKLDGTTDPGTTISALVPTYLYYSGTVWKMLFASGSGSGTVIHQYGGAFGTPGGVALTTGGTQYFNMPQACTIGGYEITADAGTATVKFWKIATGTAIPTVANVINTSGVALSSGTHIKSTTVTDFTTTTVTADDIGAVTITAVSGAGYVQAVLLCQ